MTAVALAGTFQDRLEAKLRESIADLMTPEDIRQLVERGVHKALFERREGRGDGYGRNETKPALLDEVIEKELSKLMTSALETWVRENNTLVGEALKKVIDEKAATYMLRALGGLIAGPYSNAFMLLADQLQAKGLIDASTHNVLRGTGWR